ncbi:MAG: PKD-like domain-containing protein [Saprospiraceae bacterium]
MLLFLLHILPSAPLHAQPSNDECAAAIPLTDIQNWCSAPGAFTTVGATLSAWGRPFCFPSGTTAPDVWFSFVAQAPELRISVKGAAGQNPGGTLQAPQLAIYTGNCGSLFIVNCATDRLGSNFVELQMSGLETGRTYFVRVSGRNDFRGTFQMCVSNFTPILNPLADCPTGQVLCSNNAMTVDFVSGEGVDPNELNNVCGRTGCQPTEYQSTWLKWRAGATGSLTFTITPLNPTDDIDFVLFELPNGIDNCTGRIPLRCMSSGENVGQPLSNWIACTGATGLRTGELGDIEYCGCSVGDNNFLAPLSMTAGKSYALAVVNYSRSGKGFRIEFGGTGTFAGTVSGLDPVSVLSLDKRVSRSFFPVPPAGDTLVNYAVRLVNTSATPFTIDSIADILPAPFTYQGLNAESEVTTSNSSSFPAIGANGNLRWAGRVSATVPPAKEYYLGPRDTLDLSYRARIPAGTPIGMYSGSVRAFTSGCPLPAMPASVNIGLLCPAISGRISGTTGLCAGGGTGSLQVDELENMRLAGSGGLDYGIRFVYFNTANPANVYGTPVGILGNAQLNAEGDKATLGNAVFPSNPGVYYVFAILQPVPAATACRPFAGPFVVRVFSEPLINISGSGSTCPGGTATLSATVEGGVGDCIIQWQVQQSATGTWSNIFGASGPSLTVNPVATSRYRAVLSCEGSGCPQAISNIQEISVQSDRSIVLVVPASVCAGGQTILSATVSGGLSGCSILWQLSSDGTNWVNISNTTTTSIPITPTATFLYRAQLVCPSTGCIVPSNIVTVQVAQSQDVVLSGGDAVICSGGVVPLTAAVSGGTGTCSLLWQQSTNGGASWSTVSGASGNRLQAAPVVNTQYRAIYNCPAESCAPDTSNVQTVSVIPDPRILISGGQAVCPGTNVQLTASVVRGVGTCTVVWQNWDPAKGIWEDLPGVTGTRLSVIPQRTTIYRARYFCTGSGCDEVFSNQDTIALISGPSVFISGPAEICPGGTGALVASRTGGIGACSLQWQRLNAATGNWDALSGQTKDTLVISGLSTETQYRVAFSCDGNGCSQGISPAFAVRPGNDRVVTVSGPSRICTGSTATLTSNGLVSGCSFQWKFFDVARQVWADVPGATAISLQVVPETTTDYLLSYRCGDGACQQGTSNTLRVQVNPTPTAQVSGPVSICAGQNAQLSATVSNTFTSCAVTWQSSLNGQSWTDIPNASGLSLSVAPSANIFYRIVYDCAGGCFATSNAFLLNVLPLSEVTLSGAATLCSGDSATLSANTGLAPASCTLLWQSSTNGTTWTDLPGVSSKQLRIAPSSTTFYRAQALCSGTFCTGAPSNVVQVQVFPAPAISVAGGGISCAGGTMTLSATTSGGAGQCGIQWQSSPDGNTWTNIPSATGASLAVSPTRTTRYRALYSCSGAVCNSKISNVASVEIFEDPAVSITGPTVVCKGMTATLRSNISGGTGACTLIWKSSPDGISWDAVPVVSGLSLVVAPTDTMYYKSSVVCSGLDCSEASSQVHMVVVADGPAGSNDTLQIPSCARASYDLQRNVNILGNAVPTTFTWTAINNPGVSGESTVQRSGGFINDQLTNLTRTPQTVSYRVNAGVNNQCPEGAFTVSVVVQAPAPLPCVTCINEVSVTLGDNCRTLVTPDMVLRLTPGGSCPDVITLQSLLNVNIDDGNGDNILERCGTFRYVVSLKPEYEDCYSFQTCEGVIIAKDLTPPTLVSRVGVCSRPVPLDVQWTDTLLCTDVFSVQNNLRSWQDPSYTFFTGAPLFQDVCSAACNCNIALSASDRMDFFNCPSVQTDQVWARLTRTFRGTDCSGNAREAVQVIYFMRPRLDPGFYARQGIYEIQISSTTCQAASTDAIVQAFKQQYFVFDHPRSCGTPRSKYAFFQEAVQAGNAAQLLSCSYSFQVDVLSTFGICSGGKKVRIAVRALDACTGTQTLLDTFLLKVNDTEPPVIFSNFRNVVISTRPDDCSGSFGIDLAGLNQFFGIRITDNCTPAPIVSTEVWYFGQEIVQGVPTGPVQWRQANYPRSVVRGQDGRDYLTVTKANIGRHKLVILAADSCDNTATREFEFMVQDQTVPVMVCQEMVRVSLSNTEGIQKGYGRMAVATFDKGSTDNCGFNWIRVRRAVSMSCLGQFIALGYDSNQDGQITVDDGIDWNKDGDINDFGEKFSPGPQAGQLYTPLLDYVDFFCCDLGLGEVELWGEDFSGNRNSCVAKVMVEDRIEPTWILPGPNTVRCDQAALVEALKAQSSYPKGSAGYNAIIAALGNDIQFIAGDECTALDIRLNVDDVLKCNAGYVDLSWTITKNTGVQTSVQTTAKVRLTVLALNEYNIHFPSNTVIASCASLPRPELPLDQLGCDAISVLVEDKVYPTEVGLPRGITIIRTYLAVNWCQYDDRCGSPQSWAVVMPRDTGSGGLSVMVRDRAPYDGNQEIYFDYNRNRTPDPGELVTSFIYNNPSNLPCQGVPAKQFAWLYTQEIRILDSTAPLVSGPPLAEFNITTAACRGAVNLVFSASDNCSTISGLGASLAAQGNVEPHSVMVRPDSLKFPSSTEMPLENFVPGAAVTFIGQGQWRLTGDFPEGTHQVFIRMRDASGNISQPYPVRVRVRDAFVPAPVCRQGVVANLLPIDMDSDGRIDAGAVLVPATALVAGPIFDCNGQGAPNWEGLKQITRYSVVRPGQTPDPNATDLPLVCGNLGNFVPVELYAWDAAGNAAFCPAVIFVTDTANACLPRPGLIEGKIATEEMTMLEGAEVRLDGGARVTMMTKRDGAYYFDRIDPRYSYSVAPYKQLDFTNGVSTLDMIRIKEHILGIRMLKGPYKMIAADVNLSRSITTQDLLQIQRLILNMESKFPNNMSWRFIPTAHEFSDPTNPWNFPFPESLSFDRLKDTIRNANFVAIKLGDVTGDAVANSSTVRSRPATDIFAVSTPYPHPSKGQIFRVPLSVEDIHLFAGAQFTLEYDRNAFELLDVEPGLAGEGQLGVFPEDGVVTLSWMAGEKPMPSRVLATLVFRALSEGFGEKALQINSRLTAAEAYGPGETIYLPSLVFENTVQGQPQETAELFQNVPNPFSDYTKIKFWLPEAQDAELRILDLKGRLLFRYAAFLDKGLHEINIAESTINSSGVLFYTLKAGSYTATKKMLLVH